MRHLLLFCSILLFWLTGYSQGTYTKEYDWEPNPKLNTSEYDTSLQAVYLLKNAIREFTYEDNDLVEYLLFHKRIKLLTDRAVNSFNIVYMDDKNVIEKARVIKPDGTVINLNAKDIKEGKDEDSGETYRYFAFEGLEIGSEIEYLYVTKDDPYYRGSYVTIQSKYPIRNLKYDFYFPPNLIFKFKSYNECPEIKYDTTNNEVNHWFLKIDTIPELKEEEQSNYENDLMAFAFKLNRNTATGKNDIISYGPWAKNVYEYIYTRDKKDKGVIKKIIKDIKIDDNLTETKKIRQVEDFLKKEYNYIDKHYSVLAKIPDIYKNKAFNESGAMLIYANIFKQLGIKNEIVVTTNRWNIRFDKDFESYLYLSKFLFYFPDIKQYLSPVVIYSRLGYPPQNYMNNYGLFIKEVSLGDFASGVGKVKFIEPISMDKTKNNLHVEVKFNNDFEKSDINTHLELTGYDAYYWQPILDYITDEEKLTKLKKEIVKTFDIDDEPDSYEILNGKGSDFGIKPLVINSKYNTGELTEKAGETYLFKVGQLIGPQMELYNDDERKEDIEFYYSRMYHRELVINIPEGYTANNLDKLVMNKTYLNEKGDTAFAFISNYKLENNVINITIDEWYNGLNFKKEVWDSYREVVNAAANFNKINIFFNKAD